MCHIELPSSMHVPTPAFKAQQAQLLRHRPCADLVATATEAMACVKPMAEAKASAMSSVSLLTCLPSCQARLGINIDCMLC